MHNLRICDMQHVLTSVWNSLLQILSPNETELARLTGESLCRKSRVYIEGR